MKKIILAIIVIVVIIIALGAWFLFKPSSPEKITPPPSSTQGITVDSPKANDAITSPVTISGTVNGDGWTGFEGQVGTVHLLDSSGKELAVAPLTATTDWMQLPTKFEINFYFDYPGEGSGTLVFKNENASGDPAREKSFTVPVKLTKSSSATSTVKAYFSNNSLDPAISCNKAFPVDRKIPKTQAVAQAALQELLKGPTGSESSAGFYTSINPGVQIQSLTITNGIAKVDFNEALQAGVGGSCKVTAIRTQITQTLLQFPTVKSVIISINGKTEDILQP